MDIRMKVEINSCRLIIYTQSSVTRRSHHVILRFCSGRRLTMPKDCSLSKIGREPSGGSLLTKEKVLRTKGVRSWHGIINDDRELRSRPTWDVGC